MHLFKQILLEANLLTELRDGNDKNIIAAINGVRRARIVYNDGTKDKKGKNERYILPIAYGKNKNGNKVIRAYETNGSSKRGITTPPNDREFPKWKLFRLDRIVSWSTGKKSFKNEFQTLKSQGLNVNGTDKSMVDIYALSPLCGGSSKPLSNPDVMPITSEPITKAQIEPEKDKNITISQKPLDNLKINQQISNKEAPPTQPISKVQIQPNQNELPSSEKDYTLTADDKPITKDKVENGGIPTQPQENPFDKSIDLMNRMDNLNNDEEEEENNEKESI